MNDRVAELRRSFNASFGQAPRADIAPLEKVMAIRVGSDPYGLRLADISGLFADKKVTSVPSPVGALLGIAAFRGAVLPVYDLGLLLGRPRAVAPRWMVVAASVPIGVAFERFDGYLNVPAASITPHARVEGCDWHVRELLHTDVARPIIHLRSILDTITERRVQA